MAPSTSPHSLTTSNLILHDKLLEYDHPNITIISWIDKVIREERIHWFYSHLCTALSESQNEDLDADMMQLDQRLTALTSNADMEEMMMSLNLFEQPEGLCLESPLERYLTPGGCENPSVFVRPALVEMGVQFGGTHGLDERLIKAKENVDFTKEKRRQAASEYDEYCDLGSIPDDYDILGCGSGFATNLNVGKAMNL
ncbi:hypothetical protein EYZ11_010081 [Aspergillus tanneri]|uniref:Uncharacterized protein n=1 Tax=Aspergillus tanneri TaxID=1220188 RepID=A0A4S3J6A0_9EURO|nr:uncharacterized protein ATNIH1004_007384 [Aspergillus tanneri]KAA8645963.1 hypothetical protein ATNIH1004_007384 [Aspergillus tanneri]THC90459.1 hypothetical protein EYZ11_010081 [Aspergillus tanneri]